MAYRARWNAGLMTGLFSAPLGLLSRFAAAAPHTGRVLWQEGSSGTPPVIPTPGMTWGLARRSDVVTTIGTPLWNLYHRASEQSSNQKKIKRE